MSASKVNSSRKKRLRVQFYEKGLRRCPGCNKQLHWKIFDDRAASYATVDHIIPISDGGTHHYHNLWILCGTCNSTRKSTCIKKFPTVNISDVEKEALYDRAFLTLSKVNQEKLLEIEARADRREAKKMAAAAAAAVSVSVSVNTTPTCYIASPPQVTQAPIQKPRFSFASLASKMLNLMRNKTKIST